MIELPPIGNVFTLAFDAYPREFVSRIAQEARERILQARIAELELDRNLWIELSKQRKRGFEDLQKRIPPREATEHMVTQGMLAQISNFDQSARHQVAEIWRVMYIASESKG